MSKESKTIQNASWQVRLVFGLSVAPIVLWVPLVLNDGYPPFLVVRRIGILLFVINVLLLIFALWLLYQLDCKKRTKLYFFGKHSIGTLRFFRNWVLGVIVVAIGLLVTNELKWINDSKTTELSSFNLGRSSYKESKVVLASVYWEGDVQKSQSNRCYEEIARKTIVAKVTQEELERATPRYLDHCESNSRMQLLKTSTDSFYNTSSHAWILQVRLKNIANYKTLQAYPGVCLLDFQELAYDTCSFGSHGSGGDWKPNQVAYFKLSNDGLKAYEPIQYTTGGIVLGAEFYGGIEVEFGKETPIFYNISARHPGTYTFMPYYTWHDGNNSKSVAVLSDPVKIVFRNEN